MNRVFILIFGIAAYMSGLASTLYAIGFVGNLAVPKTIDIGGRGLPWPGALLLDLLLIALFATHHSVMARQSLKSWLTRFVPQSVERSTFVFAAAALFIALFWFWEPIPRHVWHVEAPSLRALLFVVYFMGWNTVLLSTFLIGHFNFFGLAQVFSAWRGRKATDPEFQTPLLYKLLRHPLYFGLLLAFWATPDMTVGHLVFAIANTVYILIGIRFEERDLVLFHGDAYRDYRRRVPMVLPFRIL